jgi:hypothetical protein
MDDLSLLSIESINKGAGAVFEIAPGRLHPKKKQARSKKTGDAI